MRLPASFPSDALHSISSQKLSPSIMANTDVPYLQGLWKAGCSVVENKKRPPLRARIPIQHPAVIDLSPEDFWKNHLINVELSSASPEITQVKAVTLVVGSLDRDRVGKHSCALYLLLCDLLTVKVGMF